MNSLQDIYNAKKKLINEQIESPFGLRYIIAVRPHSNKGKLYLTLDNEKIYLFPDSFIEKFLKFKSLKYQNIIDSYIQGLQRYQVSEEINQTRENIQNLSYQNECKKKYEKIIKKIEISDYISKEKISKLKEKLPEQDFYFLEKIIKEHNFKYINQEEKKYHDVFVIEKENFEHKIETFELDSEQKLAVISDEISTLVSAGAGCGKTSMLLSKVKYLIRKGIDPEKILVTSFTNKTINDLEINLKDTTVIPVTLHSLGKKLIGEKRKVDENILRSIFQDLKKANSSNSIFGRLKKLFLSYLSFFQNDIEKEYENLAEGYTKKLKIEEYETQKKYITLEYIFQIIKKLEKENKTLKGQKVKSLAEAQIANFLFLNGIDYTYEKTYDLEYHGVTKETNKLYKPDFCIKQGNKEIWLEHFGVTFDNNGGRHAEWCDEEEKYIQQMDEKIRTHRENNTILIQTNQSLLHEEKLLSYLKSELLKYGITFHPLPQEKVENYFKNLQKWKKFEAFEKFIERYLSLFKSQLKYETLDEVENTLYKNKYPKKKTKVFFNILKEIYKLYEQKLKESNCIDFSDMIKKTIEKLKNTKLMDKYDYIIVDEFQDIDQSKCEMIRLLQEKNNAKLFCVGDDWQSIYGFSGSDISIFNSFAKIFPHANTSIFLKNTHRNSKELLDITSRFITKNPSQTQKELLSVKHNKYPIKVAHYFYHKETEKYNGCKTAAEALKFIFEDMKKNKLPSNVVILGRYDFDYKRIFGKDEDFYIKTKKMNNEKIVVDSIRYNKDPNLKIKFMNIHQSKGLDFDTVVLFLQEAEDQPSFPTTYEDNYLIKPLLYNKTDPYLNAEERRVFYVALTRCKEQCYIINPEETSSSFFQELKNDTVSINDTLDEFCIKTEQKICPICKSGIYNEKVNSKTNQTFWACDNRYCNVVTREEILGICPKCNGFLKERINSKTKEKFIGCSNYPRCKYVINK